MNVSETVTITNDGEVRHVEVSWLCPVCGAPNTDWYDQTAVPYCEYGGEKEFPHSFTDWLDVIDQSEIERANQLCAEIEEQSNG